MTPTTPAPPDKPRWSEFVSNGREDRPKLTWQCDKCAAEYDHFTYGGPCAEEDCDGELRHRKPAP